MPDPLNAGQFLADIPNLVKDFRVEYNNDDPDSWALHERSPVGLAPAARALFLCILAFATSQGATELAPDTFPAVPADTGNEHRDAFIIIVINWLQADCPMPAAYRTAEGEITTRWEALMNLIRPTVSLCETILAGQGFGTQALLEHALVTAHLAFVEQQQKAQIKAAADAAAAAATAIAHTAAVAAAAVGPGAGGAPVAAGGAGYSQQVVEGHVVSEAIRIRLVGSYIWVLVQAAAESKEPGDFQRIFVEPDITVNPADHAEYTATIGHLCMLISFCSKGVTSKSSSVDERDFYGSIAALQSVLPRLVFHVLETASAAASGTGRNVSYPADIEEFVKPFLNLKLAGKTTPLIDNLYHLSPHQDDYLMKMPLRSMSTKHFVDTVCTLLLALSFLFPVFAGVGADQEFRRDIESFVEISIGGVAFPGGLMALFKNVYKRVILEWADAALSCMLTNPKNAASGSATPFVTLAVRLTQAALRLNPISSAAVAMWTEQWANVNQARAFGMPGSSTATGEEAFVYIFPQCFQAVAAKQISALQRDVAALKITDQNKGGRAQQSGSNRAEKRVRDRSPSGKGKGGGAAGAARPARGSPNKKAKAPAQQSPPKGARPMSFGALTKAWASWLERKQFTYECMFVHCLGSCTPFKSSAECGMCKKAASSAPGAQGKAPAAFGPTFFAVPAHRACTHTVQHAGGTLHDKFPAHYL